MDETSNSTENFIASMSESSDETNVEEYAVFETHDQVQCTFNKRKSVTWLESPHPLEQQINSDIVKRIWTLDSSTDDSGYDSLARELSTLSVSQLTNNNHNSSSATADTTNTFSNEIDSGYVSRMDAFAESNNGSPPPGFGVRSNSWAYHGPSIRVTPKKKSNSLPYSFTPALIRQDEIETPAHDLARCQEVRKLIKDIIRQNNLNSRPLRSQSVDPHVIEETIFNSLMNGTNRREVCVFCRNNGEHVFIYTSHALKDSNNRVTCPILKAYRCPICNATGENAHTIRYCPMGNYGVGGLDRLGFNNVLNGTTLLETILKFMNYRQFSEQQHANSIPFLVPSTPTPPQQLTTTQNQYDTFDSVEIARPFIPADNLQQQHNPIIDNFLAHSRPNQFCNDIENLQFYASSKFKQRIAFQPNHGTSL